MQRSLSVSGDFQSVCFLTQDAYAACTDFSQKGRRANRPSLLAAFCPAPHATAREERLLRLFLVDVLACYMNEMTPITNTQYLFSASVMVWLEGVIPAHSRP